MPGRVLLNLKQPPQSRDEQDETVIYEHLVTVDTMSTKERYWFAMLPLDSSSRDARQWVKSMAQSKTPGFWANEPAQYQDVTIQSVSFRSPGILLGTTWDKKVDIWSVGCLVYELLAWNPLFPQDGYPEMHLEFMMLRFRADPPPFMLQLGLHRSSSLVVLSATPFHICSVTRRASNGNDMHHNIVAFFETVFRFDLCERPWLEEVV
ncbi:hypothetical protein DFH07DRAFT_766565 [Mycena maculata]|uniref:Protein kinase domain-containing protein n=1 Tax=Mycena maculata TaxID=230809 RepID=A0AAD7K2D0_9AGAR|nr:hypothetical protein DFH07DRAFT_766565 [Mycena maculata]